MTLLIFRMAFYILFIPIETYFLIHFGVNTNFEALVIGVVNNEVSNHSLCSNTNLNHVEFHENYCEVKTFSCRFIGDFDKSKVVFVSSGAKRNEKCSICLTLKCFLGLMQTIIFFELIIFYLVKLWEKYVNKGKKSGWKVGSRKFAIVVFALVLQFKNFPWD